MKYFVLFLMVAVITACSGVTENALSGPSGSEGSPKSEVSFVKELKELALSLPPYSASKDCGFEAIKVYEKFGGYIVIAQNSISDGVYEIIGSEMPPSLRDLTGYHGIFLVLIINYICYIMMIIFVIN